MTKKQRTRTPRDPERTRELILEAAREVLAEVGKEGLSVQRVAQVAGVNRGTAYQHFQTREQLLEATTASVSDKLYRAVFGDPDVTRQEPVDANTVDAVNSRLAEFAMDNPELCRVWLFEVLSSTRPANDLFWRRYSSSFERFATTSLAQPGMDVDALSVLFLAGHFFWPIWARAHTRSAKDRHEMAARFHREVLRLTLHGTLRPEKFKALDARVNRK